MSALQTLVTMEACASSDPTKPTMGHNTTSPASSAIVKLLVSSAGASQVFQVSYPLGCVLHPLVGAVQLGSQGMERSHLCSKSHPPGAEQDDSGCAAAS